MSSFCHSQHNQLKTLNYGSGDQDTLARAALQPSTQHPLGFTLDPSVHYVAAALFKGGLHHRAPVLGWSVVQQFTRGTQLCRLVSTCQPCLHKLDDLLTRTGWDRLGQFLENNVQGPVDRPVG